VIPLAGRGPDGGRARRAWAIGLGLLACVPFSVGACGSSSAPGPQGAGEEASLAERIVEQAQAATAELTGDDRIRAYSRETALDLVLVATERTLGDQLDLTDEQRRQSCRAGLADYQQWRPTIAAVTAHAPDVQLGATIIELLDDVAAAWQACATEGTVPAHELADRLDAVIEASVDLADTTARMQEDPPPGAGPPLPSGG
jgi:hypothetical protein